MCMCIYMSCLRFFSFANSFFFLVHLPYVCPLNSVAAMLPPAFSRLLLTCVFTRSLSLACLHLSLCGRFLGVRGIILLNNSPIAVITHRTSQSPPCRPSIHTRTCVSHRRYSQQQHSIRSMVSSSCNGSCSNTPLPAAAAFSAAAVPAPHMAPRMRAPKRPCSQLCAWHRATPQ